MIITGVLEYRRREQKAALERYAQRRMRRKFKLNTMQQTNENLKEFFQEEGRESSAQVIKNQFISPEDAQRKARRRQRRKERRKMLENQYNSDSDSDYKAESEHRRRKSKLR